MSAQYSIGQKVRIKQAVGQYASPSDAALDTYAGQVGEITDLYWISPRGSEIFYIYSVRVGTGFKEIALHEDEIEPHIESKSL